MYLLNSSSISGAEKFESSSPHHNSKSKISDKNQCVAPVNGDSHRSPNRSQSISSADDRLLRYSEPPPRRLGYRAPVFAVRDFAPTATIPAIYFELSEFPEYCQSSWQLYLDQLGSLREQIAASPASGHLVYLLGAGNGLPWKIGASKTSTISQRMNDLQVGSPVELVPYSECASPRRKYDTAVHAVLPRSERSHGEWWNLGGVSWSALEYIGLIPQNSTNPPVPDIRSIIATMIDRHGDRLHESTHPSPGANHEEP